MIDLDNSRSSISREENTRRVLAALGCELGAVRLSETPRFRELLDKNQHTFDERDEFVELEKQLTPP